MDKSKPVFGLLLVFLLSAATKTAFAQAAAEAGLVNGLSSTTTSAAASRLSGATNRALQGQSNKLAATTTSHTATTTSHRTQPTASKTSATSTKTAHTAASTTTDHPANLPPGIVHVWPPDALNQSPQ